MQPTQIPLSARARISQTLQKIQDLHPLPLPTSQPPASVSVLLFQDTDPFDLRVVASDTRSIKVHSNFLLEIGQIVWLHIANNTPHVKAQVVDIQKTEGLMTFTWPPAEA